MADIPSPIASSVAGAPLQAKDAVESREARRAGQHHAAKTQVQSVDEAGATVETHDDDSRVFADAEGTGSQGRQMSEDSESSSDGGCDETDAGGITIDKEGNTHLDLRA